jgi:Fic family protein
MAGKMAVAGRLGRYETTSIGGEKVRAFIPPALPPDPPIAFERLLNLLSDAERALGRLDGIGLMVPDTKLFLYMYVRKEAVLSSQIEGTQSTLSDLLRFEMEAKAGRPFDDVVEVSNYVDAMMHGLARLPELPLSLRLMREMHERLMRSGRGETKSPGEFRTSQNWIGGSRPGNAMFVPPPPHLVMPCLDDFERYIHADSPLPALIRAALLHVQFETIHPFLDGNGRLGRLLITLYLCEKRVLHEPLLYLSLYFKTHRADYYRLLQEVRERGAWEAWLEFFLDGVADTANQAFDAAKRIVTLFKEDRERIVASDERSSSLLKLHDHMKTSPFVSAPRAVAQTGLSMPTVQKAIARLEAVGLLAETTGRKRDRVYAYRAYLDILSEGAQAPARRNSGS